MLCAVDGQVVGGPDKGHGQPEDGSFLDQVGEAIDHPTGVVLEGGGIGKVQQGLVLDLKVVVEAGLNFLGVDLREAGVQLLGG